MDRKHEIRAATSSDAASIKLIAVQTGLFEPEEMGEFEEILSGYLNGSRADDFWIVLQGVDGEIVGAAYYAPEPFSDRVWNLYFIGVMPVNQASGAGSALIRHVENALRRTGEAGARVLIVETSGLDKFELTRAFYRRHGFDEEARIRQFYGPNDDKVIFWKSLTT